LFFYQIVKFCEGFKTDKKFIDDVIINIMNHSSFDLCRGKKKRATLMASVFIKLHQLIELKQTSKKEQKEQTERITNILKTIKSTIRELEKSQLIFKNKCIVFSKEYKKAFKEAFKNTNEKGFIVDIDENENGDLIDFIVNSSGDDSNSSGDDSGSDSGSSTNSSSSNSSGDDSNSSGDDRSRIRKRKRSN